MLSEQQIDMDEELSFIHSFTKSQDPRVRNAAYRALVRISLRHVRLKHWNTSLDLAWLAFERYETRTKILRRHMWWSSRRLRKCSPVIAKDDIPFVRKSFGEVLGY